MGCSSVADVLKFYNMIVGEPEMLGLSKASMTELIAPRIPVSVSSNTLEGSKVYFAQGTIVREFEGTNATAVRIQLPSSFLVPGKLLLFAWKNVSLTHVPAFWGSLRGERICCSRSDTRLLSFHI